MNEKPPLLTYDEAKARGLWFISKRFGWGWFPISWQGWLTILAYVALLTSEAMRTIWSYYPTENQVIEFVIGVMILTAVLIRVCYVKGEKPYWRWGK